MSAYYKEILEGERWNLRYFGGRGGISHVNCLEKNASSSIPYVLYSAAFV